jgi:hypothetical protein
LRIAEILGPIRAGWPLPITPRRNHPSQITRRIDGFSCAHWPSRSNTHLGVRRPGHGIDTPDWNFEYDRRDWRRGVAIKKFKVVDSSATTPSGNSRVIRFRSIAVIRVVKDSAMRARWIVLVIVLIAGLIGPSLAGADLPFARSTVDPSPILSPVAKGLADLDGDGLLDPVVAGPGGEVFWYAAVDGLRRPLVVSAAAANDGLETVDVDGDADLDIVLANGVWLRNPSNVGNALVDPWIAASYATGAGRDVAVADLDGDLDVDIVRRDATGDVRIHTQQSGLFSEVGSIAVGPSIS